MPFQLKPNRFSKITGDAGPPAMAAALLRVIIEVTKSGYVPKGVNVRAKIDARLFTADVKAAVLADLDKDTQVKSVAISQPLRPIE